MRRTLVILFVVISIAILVIACGGQPISSKEEAARRQPGGSNAGEYTHVANYNFAGNACGIPGAYPVDTIERGRAALSLAHNVKDPECIREQVYKKYPKVPLNSNLPLILFLLNFINE